MNNKYLSKIKTLGGILCTFIIIFIIVSVFVQGVQKISALPVANTSTYTSEQKTERKYELKPKKIEEIQIGERVSGLNPDISDEDRIAFSDPDSNLWKLVKLEMIKSDGSILYIELLRSPEWFAITNPVVGKNIFLDLLELGAWGEAKVLSIENSPPIHQGPGNVVTGKFSHNNAKIIRLTIEGQKKTIGCTNTHPFWSVDRMAFIEAGDLQKNELLKLHNGTNARLLNIIEEWDIKNVYNLEVHNEHVFEITESGILVHNSCEFVLHHAVPKFLGGADEQIYAILKVGAHREYHDLLREALIKKGLWDKAFKYGTGKGSAEDWKIFFKAEPTAQYQAFEAVLESGAELAKKYPEEAMKLLDAFWDSLSANKWTMIYK